MSSRAQQQYTSSLMERRDVRQGVYRDDDGLETAEKSYMGMVRHRNQLQPQSAENLPFGSKGGNMASSDENMVRINQQDNFSNGTEHEGESTSQTDLEGEDSRTFGYAQAQGFQLKRKSYSYEDDNYMASDTENARKRHKRRRGSARRNGDVYDDGRSSAVDSETGSVEAAQGARMAEDEEDEDVEDEDEEDDDTSQDNHKKIDEAELRVRRTRRGVYKSKKKEQADAEINRTVEIRRRGRGGKRNYGPRRSKKQQTETAGRKRIVKRPVSTRDIEIVFDLSNDPCLKYNISQVLDPGTEYTEWTSFKLKERTIYMDTIANRYEICREDDLSNDGFDQYKISKVKNARNLGVSDMSSFRIPLPEEHLEVLYRHVKWEEIMWSLTGVRIRDLKLKLHCLRFCLNIDPVHREQLKEDDKTALENAFKEFFPVEQKTSELCKFPEFTAASENFH